MFGLFTRTSAIVTTILALYVFGIPQMFGKVNHSHHMVWLPRCSPLPCGPRCA